MNAKFAAVLALAFAPGLVAAQTVDVPRARENADNTRYGGTSAVFLTLPADARGAALGGSFASLASDITATFYNPAGLALMTSSQAMFNFTDYVAGTRHITGALGWSLRGGEAGLGVSISNFGFSDQPVYTELDQEGNGETYSVSNTAVGVTGSLQFSDRFSAGITGRMVTEQLGRASATGFTVDFGTNYHAELGGKPFRASFIIVNYGTSLKHSGPVLNTDVDPLDESMNVEVQPTVLRTSAFEPPTQFRVGIAYDAMSASNRRLTLLSEFFQPNDSDPGFGAGAEFMANVAEGLSASLRGSFSFAGDNGGDSGGVSSAFSQSAFSSDNGKESLDGLALGGGLNWRSGEWNVGVDYAFRHMGLLSGVHMFSVKLGW